MHLLARWDCGMAATLVMGVLGCGGGPSQPSDSTVSSSAITFDAKPPSGTLPAASKIPRMDAKPRTAQPAPAESQTLVPPRTLADLVPPANPDPNGPISVPPLPIINDVATLQLGIRKLVGKHLVLYTDLPASPAIDELPLVFDLAVPQWGAYFSVADPQTAAWKVAGYLIKDKERFRRAGLIPADLPDFLHGFHRGAEMWLYEQPAEYYRRHLLLHEGTHAFMIWSLGGAGPPWYMEGTAELFATHRWRNGQLTLRTFPNDKKEVPEWGRIKIVKDDVTADRGRTLMDVMHYDSRAHLRVEPYGWCWAAAAFFDNHPAYQQRFRELQKVARDTEPTFSERFVGWFRDDGQQLWREWQWFVVNIDYGYDVAREAIQHQPVAPLPGGGSTVQIAADRGWQSTGVRIEAAHKYRIAASGRYQLGTQPKIWWSEPNGVTIRYYRGQPLGILLGAVVDESDPQATDNGFLSAIPLGTGMEITPPLSGTLYLRINDAPGELSDNQGVATVRITVIAE